MGPHKAAFPNTKSLIPVLVALVMVSGSVHGWSSFRGDVRNTGYVNETLNENEGLSPTTGWVVKLDSAVSCSPVMGDFGVVVGTENGTLYCLDRSNGGELWTSRMSGPIRSTPAYSDDTGYVIVCDDTGRATAFRAIDGSEVWTWQSATGGQVISSPLVARSRVVFGSYDSSVYCLSERNGSLMWRFTGCSGWVHTSPALSGEDVLFGSCDGTLNSVSILNGTRSWHFQDSYIPSSPAVDRGRVFFGSYDENLYCLNTTDGSVVWNTTLGDGIASSPSVGSSVVVVGCDDGNLYCLERGSGSFIWSARISAGALDSSPVLFKDHVAVTGSDGILILSLNGSVAHRFQLGDPGGTSPAYYDGSMVFGDTLGYLHSIDLKEEIPDEDGEGKDRPPYLLYMVAFKTFAYVVVAAVLFFYLRKRRL